MFTRHTVEFADVNSARAVNGSMLTLELSTMLETREGWKPVSDLDVGTGVATLDGGFAPISWIGRALPLEQCYLVPAGALDNCSDLTLPGRTMVGLEAPLDMDVDSDVISVPLSALEGHRGIRPSTGDFQMARTFGFDQEEMIWAQTGVMLHARQVSDNFFQSLPFAEARSAISLITSGHFEASTAA